MTPTNEQIMASIALTETIRSSIRNCINYGWWISEVDSSGIDENCFKCAVEEIGDPLNARSRNTGVELLVPAPKQSAPPSSLSAAHGQRVFPLHTDGAHWPHPPRFLVMMCLINEECRPTTLLHWRSAKKLLLNSYSRERATFLVRNGAKSFYSSFHHNGTESIRYDRQCMQPANREAEILDSELNEISNSVEPKFVQWTPGMLLAIDNHSVLHGRGEARGSGDRQLLRAIYAEVKP